jgi:hypothetical protein
MTEPCARWFDSLPAAEARRIEALAVEYAAAILNGLETRWGRDLPPVERGKLVFSLQTVLVYLAAECMGVKLYETDEESA